MNRYLKAALCLAYLVGVLCVLPQSHSVFAAIATCADLQAAIDATHASGGGFVDIPAGTIQCDTTIDWYGGVHLSGQGAGQTVINSTAAVAIQIADGSGGGGYISDLRINGEGRAFWTNGRPSTRLIFDRVWLDGRTNGYGFDVDAMWIECVIRDSVVSHMGRINTGAGNSWLIENTRFGADPTGAPDSQYVLQIYAGGGTSSGFAIRDSVFETAGLLIDGTGGNLFNVTLDGLAFYDPPTIWIPGLVIIGEGAWMTGFTVRNVMAEGFMVRSCVPGASFAGVYGYNFDLCHASGVWAWGIQTATNGPVWSWDGAGTVVQHEGTLYGGW